MAQGREREWEWGRGRPDQARPCQVASSRGHHPKNQTKLLMKIFYTHNTHTHSRLAHTLPRTHTHTVTHTLSHTYWLAHSLCPLQFPNQSQPIVAWGDLLLCTPLPPSLGRPPPFGTFYTSCHYAKQRSRQRRLQQRRSLRH